MIWYNTSVSTRTYSTNYFRQLESWYTYLEKRLLTDVNNYCHLTKDFIHDVNRTDKWTQGCYLTGTSAPEAPKTCTRATNILNKEPEWARKSSINLLV